MTTSVAMCTYNGANFIEKQLCTILSQTIPVGEIVICDDRSSDDTLEIINRIALDTDIPFRIHVNDSNLGYIRNFEKVVNLCKGDIIFLSDQDDLWQQNKVEEVCNWFMKNPCKDVVFTDALLIDGCGNPILKSVIPNAPATEIKGIDEPLKLWETIGFSKLSQKQFNKGLGFELWIKNNRATGATMAFRKKYVQSLDKLFKQNTICHDYFISFIALMNDSLGFISSPLISYRLHTNQTIGCSLNFPKHQSFDDSRAWEVYNEELDSLITKKEYRDRLAFGSTRLAFKQSFFSKRVIGCFVKYIQVYRRNWFYMFWYDFSKSMRFTIKKILRYRFFI